MLLLEEVVFSIGRFRILNHVTFGVRAGETVGLIGPNGSGKTTLFNCISGFNVPELGKIMFRGNDVTRSRPHERAALGLGRVFQNSGVFREMTLLENVVVALEGRQALIDTFFPWSKQNKLNRARALELLAEANLADRAKDKASSLSGGQLRLLEIVRTLGFGAELFLLDEPTAGVSPRMKEEVAKLIAKLKDLKKTVLIIEHDINFIQQFCERVVVLDVGKVVLDDTPSNIRSNPLLHEIYFGSKDNHVASPGRV